jgi:hypothetical protein
MNTLQPINSAVPVNRAHPLNQGRVRWWLALPYGPFGRAYRELMVGSHGLLTENAGSGQPAWAGSSRPGGSSHLNFDGSNDKVTVPAVTFAGAYTLAFWARDTAVNGSVYIGGNGANDRYGLSSTQIILRVANVATAINHSEGSTVRWRRWVIARDASGNATVYWDGVAMGTRAVAGTATIDTFGCRADNISFYAGALDDVTLWDRTLGAAEIALDFDVSRRGYPRALNRFVPPKWGQIIPDPPTRATFYPGLINHALPLNRAHSLNQGRIRLYLALPYGAPNRTYRDLASAQHGALVDHGSSTGGPAWAGSSRPAGYQHLTFDGSNDRVTFPQVDLAGPFSVGFWIRDTNVSGAVYLSGPSTQNNISLSSTLIFARINNTADFVSHGDSTVVMWKRILITRNSSNVVTFYINGQSLGTKTLTGTFSLDRIGGRGDGASSFTGDLDGLSIWDRSIGAAGATLDYALERAGLPGVLSRFQLTPHDVLVVPPPMRPLPFVNVAHSRLFYQDC